MFDVRLPENNEQFFFTYTVTEKVTRPVAKATNYIRGNCAYCRSEVWSNEKQCKNCGAFETYNSIKDYIKRRR